jgi:predicted DNA-binding WGR domain protein
LKLVRQAKLFFQEGTSDKVYEIDLCESGDGFLVNFRYGRRGASLKEGTKTIFPVPLAEAEKVFAALEQEKRKKG